MIATFTTEQEEAAILRQFERRAFDRQVEAQTARVRVERAKLRGNRHQRRRRAKLLQLKKSGAK